MGKLFNSRPLAANYFDSNHFDLNSFKNVEYSGFTKKSKPLQSKSLKDSIG